MKVVNPDEDLWVALEKRVETTNIYADYILILLKKAPLDVPLGG
jgi:hypothetical protein